MGKFKDYIKEGTVDDLKAGMKAAVDDNKLRKIRNDGLAHYDTLKPTNRTAKAKTLKYNNPHPVGSKEHEAFAWGVNQAHQMHKRSYSDWAQKRGKKRID